MMRTALMVLAATCSLCAQAGHHAQKGANLDERVQRLSKALELDDKQAHALRGVLERQRDDVAKVWNESSVPAPYRVNATQAINERTADNIRALLNEEQRKKYNPPRQPHAPPEGIGRRSVEEWMYPERK